MSSASEDGTRAAKVAQNVRSPIISSNVIGKEGETAIK